MDIAKVAGLLTALFLPCVALAAPPSAVSPWYRDTGEYMASRSVRLGLSTDPSTKILTNGQRFDVSVGKRIPLYSWSEVSKSEGWAFGIDGGMLASLEKSTTRTGTFIFATNTFDGFFGGWLGYAAHGWLVMFRIGHLSAHMVDNSPNFLTPVTYSQFWNELLFGKELVNPEEKSPWDIYLQGSVGLNNTSAPTNKQPRASFGADLGYSFWGAGTPGILLSADVLRAGVQRQNPTYSFFAGIGTVNRPYIQHRPWRAGLAYFTGSDYRNQYYSSQTHWTALEVQTEF